jgi:Holliday junction resolvasome RuvABC endonuclease subunit
MAKLALDLGTTTGWAFRSGPNTMSGTWKLAGGRFEGGGMRGVRFKRYLDEMHAADPITEIVFEEVRNHKGVDAAHWYGGLWLTLCTWCEENDVPYEGVSVGEIKKFATGKGNANKDKMIEAVRSWGYEPADDNEADAIALLHLCCAKAGDVEAPTAAMRDEVLG